MIDDMGDRMKAYEKVETSKTLSREQPIYARIDGRSFSNFTRNMARPFDPAMHELMRAATNALVIETRPTIAYTQSDEISLGWAVPKSKDAQLFFDGKIQKLTSVLGGIASAAFMMHLSNSKHRERMIQLPHFDARIFNVPDEDELTNAFLWRFKDARRNAVSMAARSMFSAKAMDGKSTTELREMMAEKGVNFDDYPKEFRFGTLFTWTEQPRSSTTRDSYQKAGGNGMVFRKVISPMSVDLMDVTHDQRKELFFEG